MPNSSLQRQVHFSLGQWPGCEADQLAPSESQYYTRAQLYLQPPHAFMACTAAFNLQFHTNLTLNSANWLHVSTNNFITKNHTQTHKNTLPSIPPICSADATMPFTTSKTLTRTLHHIKPPMAQNYSCSQSLRKCKLFMTICPSLIHATHTPSAHASSVPFGFLWPSTAKSPKFFGCSSLLTSKSNHRSSNPCSHKYS